MSLLQLILSSYTPSLRKVRTETQGSNPGAGTEAEAMEECSLLVSCYWLLQPPFLQHPGPPA